MYSSAWPRRGRPSKPDATTTTPPAFEPRRADAIRVCAAQNGELIPPLRGKINQDSTYELMGIGEQAKLLLIHAPIDSEGDAQSFGNCMYYAEHKGFLALNRFEQFRNDIRLVP